MTKKNIKLHELFRFFVSGGITTAIDMSVMALVIYLFDNNTSFIESLMSKAQSVYAVVLGTSLGFIVSFIASYALSIFYVFKAIGSSFAKSRRGVLLYLLISLISFTMHTVGMYVGFEIFGMNEWALKVALTLIVMLFSYTARKILIFKKPIAT